jgi:hypothetical protein
MAKGNPGADSSSPVTDDLINTATRQFGQAPLFWGRYFTSPTASGSVEYRHGSESPVLARHNIRLLPVARQTAHVGGSQQQGAADAQLNVQDILDTFGQDYLASQGGEFLLFLDVEGSPSTGSPSLSRLRPAGRQPDVEQSGQREQSGRDLQRGVGRTVLLQRLRHDGLGRLRRDSECQAAVRRAAVAVRGELLRGHDRL